MPWGAAGIGLLVGFLIGLTGMGGGAMMTPLLLRTGWAAPTVAVGTDMVWNVLTKVVGAGVHHRHRNVNLKLVWWLASGSVPGALLGLYLLALLKKHASLGSVDHLIVRLLGGALILVAVAIIFKQQIHRWLPPAAMRPVTDENLKSWQVPLLGFVVGVSVSFTSVGSGSLRVTTLLLLFPGERLSRLVAAMYSMECSLLVWPRSDTGPGRCETAAGIRSSVRIYFRSLAGKLYHQPPS